MKRLFTKAAVTISFAFLAVETVAASTQAEQLQDFWIEFRAATQSELDYPKLGSV